MPVERTAEELHAAIASMFRIRAVESPPNEKGIRTVWHRGAKQAELVSEIDGEGHVVRHEFTLFGDVVIWERGHGLSTGSMREASRGAGGDSLELDLGLDDVRLSRVSGALRPWGGDDRIIAHLKMLLTAGIGNPLEGRGRVTSNPAALSAPPVEPALRPRVPVGLWVAIGAAVLVIIVMLVLLAR